MRVNKLIIIIRDFELAYSFPKQNQRLKYLDIVTLNPTMIRQGKSEGWLRLSNAELPAWALLNGVEIKNNVAIGSIPGHEERGSAIIARNTNLDMSCNPLLVVPGDLVLSLKTIERQSRYDPHLLELLTAAGDFAMVSPEIGPKR